MHMSKKLNDNESIRSISNGMKLLIVTQAVDERDQILGFFVRWLSEFAKHCEQVEVICLREGKHKLPANVHVHSLGKTAGDATVRSGIFRRVAYSLRFLRIAWKLHANYDTVLVHMNPEYVVLAGLFWRFLGKRVALWYTHKNVDLKLRLATLLASVIFTASKESFRLSTTKLHVMGHGIDVDFFSPDPAASRDTAVLSVGRFSPTKRHDLVLRAATHFPYNVWLVGDGPEHRNLEKLAESLSLSSRVHFFGAHTHEELRDEYRRASVFVHTSETGSLDKVVLEALACGLPVVTTSTALRDLPVTLVAATPEAIAEGVRTAQGADTHALPAYVREHHSLQKLIPAMLHVLQQA